MPPPSTGARNSPRADVQDWCPDRMRLSSPAIKARNCGANAGSFHRRWRARAFGGATPRPRGNQFATDLLGKQSESDPLVPSRGAAPTPRGRRVWCASCELAAGGMHGSRGRRLLNSRTDVLPVGPRKPQKMSLLGRREDGRREPFVVEQFQQAAEASCVSCWPGKQSRRSATHETYRNGERSQAF